MQVIGCCIKQYKHSLNMGFAPSIARSQVFRGKENAARDIGRTTRNRRWSKGNYINQAPASFKALRQRYGLSRVQITIHKVREAKEAKASNLNNVASSLCNITPPLNPNPAVSVPGLLTLTSTASQHCTERAMMSWNSAPASFMGFLNFQLQKQAHFIP